MKSTNAINKSKEGPHMANIRFVTQVFEMPESEAAMDLFGCAADLG